MAELSVSDRVFSAMQVMDIERLCLYSNEEIRPVLPYLVRMSLCAPVDHSEKWKQTCKSVLKILSEIEAVNGILALLSIDFHALQEDTKREQQLRKKLGCKQSDSVLISQLEHGVIREFEQCDADRKLRLVLSHVLFAMFKVNEIGNEYTYQSNELFDDAVYVDDVSDVLCIAHAELPLLLPLPALAETLLRMKYGHWMICKLLANMPESFMEVCEHLIHNAVADSNSSISSLRTHVLESLCSLNPNDSLYIRELCVQKRVLPVLVIRITLSFHRHDVTSGAQSYMVEFLTGLLLSDDLAIQSWFAQFIKFAYKNADLSAVVEDTRQVILAQLTNLTPDDGHVLQAEAALELSGIFRLYCVLRLTAAFKLSNTEVTCLWKLMTSETMNCPSTSRFLQLCVCMPLVYPSLVQNTNQEKMLTQFIKRLMDKTTQVTSNAVQTYRDLLFLLAIHFHGSHKDAINDLVANTLGIKIAIKANALNRVRDIFTKEIFTELVITNEAASLPVIANLNADLPGYLAVHSIHQLLKSRTFTKHKVQIKDWIYKQICNLAPPLHPEVIPLIEAYIHSIILPGVRTESTNQTLTESEILAVFPNSVFDNLSPPINSMEVDIASGDNLLSQLVMVYYVLLYEDIRCTNIRSLAKRQVPSYSTNLLNQLPISHVILATQTAAILPTDLFAPLLRLLTTHCPHLCLVEDWLDNALLNSSFAVTSSYITDSERPSLEQFKQAVTEANSKETFTALTCHLTHLCNTPLSCLLPYTETLLACFPVVLSSAVPRLLLESMKCVWFRIHSVIPRRLRLLTLQTLQAESTNPATQLPITDKDVTIDPLLVLRCHPKVFRCPAVLEILLRILSAYLQASRVYLASHIQQNPIIDKSAGGAIDLEREELKNALITTQESAVVQILLECCLASDNEHDMMSEMQEVRGLICSRLHQMFIADPNLVKLIHFQGYDSRLLPVTVSGIPSMHICLDFVTELIRQPHVDKQIFAIQLVAQLSRQYALPKTLANASLCIDVMVTLLQVFENQERAAFFCKTLSCLVPMCRTFPSLCEHASSLLTQVGRIALSHLSTLGVKHPTIIEDHSHGKYPLSETNLLLNKHGGAEPYYTLYETVQQTFTEISENALFIQGL